MLGLTLQQGQAGTAPKSSDNQATCVRGTAVTERSLFSARENDLTARDTLSLRPGDA